MFKKIFKKSEPTHEEFRLVYDMFYSRVYRDVYFITKDSHLAQDALQETFVKAYKYMHRLEDKERMGAWLSTIATRTAIDLLRKRKGAREVLTEDIMTQEKNMTEKSFDTLHIVEANLVKEELLESLKELKADYREVILLRYIHDLSIREIAHSLNINESTVKTRLHRARNKVKEKVQHDPKRQWIGGE
ncbi:sigma-70 family RNA polymerase sigma factor [Gracilibacillus salitolerans]|uniref:Sigma-70 family RNA polymerase sigma factor n=1 Tax=Gracilibacillus salitolerans TaxID=2663022 RepID=A0A5Q2TFK9_9BACI|nr:RNA polymerase sigma factor [Gracilibacillus salitolerans]QGH32997.1 sigma-70 family RNA polymerase sigma factor [Gracilibacillus salitolerans]